MELVLDLIDLLVLALDVIIVFLLFLDFSVQAWWKAAYIIKVNI